MLHIELIDKQMITYIFSKTYSNENREGRTIVFDVYSFESSV